MSPAPRPLAELIAAYPRGVPRDDLRAVEEALAAAGVRVPARCAVVVGTNGKTSTATYLERLLRAGGLATGLTVSPHVQRFTERVLLSGEEIGADELAGRLWALHEVAQELPGRAGLRFFDLLTLAAAEAFSAHGAGAAVLEAGVGGRLDAVACLQAPLVVLTGIALDHTELLGATREEILEEKLRVAGPGATVVAPRLGDPALDARADALARELGLAALHRIDPGTGGFRARNLHLARAAAREAARLWGLDPALAEAPIALQVPGRLQRLRAAGVDAWLDAAHNEQGWSAFLAEAPRAAVAVVSVPADRPAAPLAALLAAAGAAAVVATCAEPGRSLPAGDLARALAGAGSGTGPGAAAPPGRPVDDPAAAVHAGLAEARERGVPLVVFGSSYLLGPALAALAPLADAAVPSAPALEPAHA